MAGIKQKQGGEFTCFSRYQITHTGVSNTMYLKQLSFKGNLISLGSVLLALSHKQMRYRLEELSYLPKI